jgi:non-homologous end joining protein Ku
MAASYFLAPDELAEQAYQVVRRQNLAMLRSEQLADKMVEYIQRNHYHIVSYEISLACYERAGCVVPPSCDLR